MQNRNNTYEFQVLILFYSSLSIFDYPTLIENESGSITFKTKRERCSSIMTSTVGQFFKSDELVTM